MENSQCLEPFMETKYAHVDYFSLSEIRVLGLLKSESSKQSCLMLFPSDIEEFVKDDVIVNMESKFGELVSIPDEQYTAVGSSITDNLALAIQESNVIVKFSPFTYQELLLMRDKQRIISPFDAETLTKEHIFLMEQKKITATAMNFLVIENEQLEPYMPSKISAMINSLFSPNLSIAVETSSLLLQSVYCFQGILCKREVSEIVELPWKNVFMLF